MIATAPLGRPDWSEWERLAHALDLPFLDPGYLAIVSDECGSIRGGCAPRGSVRVLGCWRDSALVGALPLARWMGSSELFALEQDPTPGLLAADSDAARSLAGAALSQRGAWPVRLAVGDVEAEISQSIVAEWQERGRAVWVRERGQRQLIEISTSFEDYLASRSKKLRKDLRRRERRLRERGEVVTQIRTRGEGVDEFLDEAWAIEASGWKGQAGSALSLNPRLDRFYRRLARWAAERGYLWIGEMRVDGRLVAFDLGLRSGSRVWFLKGGYDQELAAASPGHLMLLEGIRLGAERGVTSFDLMGADEEYKRRWATRSSRGGTLIAFHAGPLGQMERRGALWAREGVARARRAF